jgi:branched-chain amino acid transport system substrate-binding protein
MRTLAKSAAQRFASMAEVVTALGAAEDATVRRAPLPRAATRREPPARAPVRRMRGRALGLGLVAAALVGIFAFARARRAEGPVTSSAGGGECATNRDCLRRPGSPAALCRQRTCVPIASDDCRVLAEASDLENDRTIWFGAMFPLKGDDAAAFGTSNAQAVDLARQDFVQMRGGFTGPVRPIGVVSCDDSADAARAARHLVLDLRLPAVIGFRTAAELIDLAGSILIPNDVMVMASLTTSPLIGSIPHAPGQPRLVWRTTFNSVQTAEALGAIVPELLEPQVRAQGKLAPAAPIRVALLRSKATRLSAFSDSFFQHLTFNGRTALANADDYREFVFDEDATKAASEYAGIVGGLLAFAPHVVVYVGGDALVTSVLEPLEGAWRERQRPRYVAISPLSREVFAFAAADPERRRRFFGVGEASTTQNNARFVMHYNEVFRDHITRADAPNSSYDAFYLLAYASYAAGDGPITGASLASAMRRLVPPGRPIDVGIADIFNAFTVLRRGESIDFSGATGPLDFDLETGDAPFDQSVLCVGVDDRGRAADNLEAGVVYDAKAKKLRGAPHCP